MNIQLITREQYAHRYWKHPGGFNFAAPHMVAGLVLEEMVTAQKSLTIAFMQHEGNYFPVALLGLKQGQNAYVNAQGQWQANTYIPAIFRTYPFHIALNEEQQAMLCIDEDSGYVNDNAGECFFNEAGEATDKLQQLLAILTRAEQSKQLTQRAMTSLLESGIIESWPLTIKSEHGDTQLEGLYRLNETKLTQLCGETLEKLMKTGAILIAYAHFFSQQNLQSLVDLVQSQTTVKPLLPTNQSGELDLEFLNNGGALNFSNFM